MRSIDRREKLAAISRSYNDWPSGPAAFGRFTFTR
jgi:hypothetical protein